jgi:hypothetical protein
MACLPQYKGKRYNSLDEINNELPKEGKAYLVKDKANISSAIHEIFTHPFLISIQKTNPTMYNNLLKEAKSNKEVVDWVNERYGNKNTTNTKSQSIENIFIPINNEQKELITKIKNNIDAIISKNELLSTDNGSILYKLLSNDFKSELNEIGITIDNFANSFNEELNKLNNSNWFVKLWRFINRLFNEDKMADLVNSIKSSKIDNYFTEKGNLLIYGITNNQKSKIPYINEILHKGIIPSNYSIKRVMINIPKALFIGRNYEDFIDTIRKWRDEDVKNNVKEENKIIPKWASNITKEQYNKREDAWRLSNGLPQKHNTFKYIGRGYLDSDYNLIEDSNGEDIYGFVNPSFQERTLKKQIDTTNAVMGKYAIKIGKDNVGQYIQYNDRWDLDITNAFIKNIVDTTQKPFIVTGKIYKAMMYDEVGNPIQYYTHNNKDKNITVHNDFIDYIDNIDNVDNTNLYFQNANNQNVSQQTLDHEYIARAMDLVVNNEVFRNKKENKTLVDRLQELLKELSDYLKKLFNLDKVYPYQLDPRITLKQLAEFALYAKTNIPLVTDKTEYTNNILFQKASEELNIDSVNRKDIDLSERMFNNADRTDVKDMLETIASSNVLSPLAKHLLNILKSTAIGEMSIVLMTREEIQSEYESQKDPRIQGFFTGSKIIIVKDANFKYGNATSTVLHEIIHAFVNDYIQVIAPRELSKVFDHAKKHTKNPSLYGYTDQLEFVSEFFTNSMFMNDLLSIEPMDKNYKSVFHELYDYIMSILKIKHNRSLYEEAFPIMMSILDEGKKLKAHKQLSISTKIEYDRPKGSYPELGYYRGEALKIYNTYIKGKQLQTHNIEHINRMLKRLCDSTGDVPWHVRMSKKGNYYIAGYKNGMVTSQDYYSPYLTYYSQEETTPVIQPRKTIELVITDDMMNKLFQNSKAVTILNASQLNDVVNHIAVEFENKIWKGNVDGETLVAINNELRQDIMKKIQSIQLLTTNLEKRKADGKGNDILDATIESNKEYSQALLQVYDNWYSIMTEAWNKRIYPNTGIKLKQYDEDGIAINFTLNEENIQEFFEGIEEEDIEQPEKIYSKTSSEINHKLTVPFEIKSLLSRIPEYPYKIGKNQMIEAMRGFAKLIRYKGFDYYYNRLHQVMAEIPRVPSSYEEIIELLKQKSRTPGMLWIYNENPSNTTLISLLEEAPQMVKNKFVTMVTKHNTTYEYVSVRTNKKHKTNRYSVFNTNNGEAISIIIDKWKGNILGNLVYYKQSNDTYIFDILKAKKAIEDYNEIVKSFKQVDEEFISKCSDWLYNFGISVKKETLEDIFKNGYVIYEKEGDKIVTKRINSINEMFSVDQNSYGLFGTLGFALKDMVQKQEQTKDFTNYDVINGDDNIFKRSTNVLKALASVEKKYTGRINTMSSRDGNKTLYSITDHNLTTQIGDNLVDFKEDYNAYIDMLLKNTFSKHSMWLDTLMKNTKFRTTFNIVHLPPTTIKKHGSKSYGTAEIDKLDDIDHEILKLGMFQNSYIDDIMLSVNGTACRNARYLMPNMGKPSIMSVNAFALDLRENSFVIIDGHIAKIRDNVMDTIYEQLVLPEVSRIIASKKIRANQNLYDKASKLFHLLPFLNNLKINEEGLTLVQYLNGDNANIEDVKPLIMDALSKYTIIEAKEKLNDWTNLKIGSDLMDSEYMKQRSSNADLRMELAAFDYVINQRLAHANIFMSIFQDAANFANSAMFNNDLFMDGNPLLPKKETSYQESAKILDTNLTKRLAMFITPKRVLANSEHETYIQLMLADRKIPSINIKMLMDQYYPGKYGENAELISNAFRQDIVGKNTRKKLANDFPLIAAQFEVEPSDAQEYITWQEALDNMYRTNPKFDESTYQTVKRKLSDQSLNGVNENNKLSKEEHVIFQPTKPVYTGLVNEGDRIRNVYIKSATVALIPQMTASFPQIDALRKDMEKIQFETGKTGKAPMMVRASYNTANKVGTTSKALEIWDENGNYKYPNIDGIIANANQMIIGEEPFLLLERKYFGIQQDVPYKSSHKSYATLRYMSQLFKILFGDDVSNEVPSEWLDNFNNLHVDMIHDLANSLYKELHMDKNGNTSNKLKSIIAVKTILSKMAADRGFPSQDIDALNIVPVLNAKGKPIDYQFEMPVWLSPNGHKFASLMNSIVTNRITKIDMPGNSFVVASDEGFSFADMYLGDVVWTSHRTSNRLEANQCLIPCKFENNNGELLDLMSKDESGNYIYIKEINGNFFINEEAIPNEMLSFISVRIPTSGHISASKMQIVGFLPTYIGDEMIISNNLFKQKGLDCDVDKEYTYRKWTYLDKDGKMHIMSNENNPSDLKKSLYDEKKSFRELERTMYAEANKQLFDNIQTVDKNTQLMQELFVEMMIQKSTLTMLQNQAASNILTGILHVDDKTFGEIESLKASIRSMAANIAKLKSQKVMSEKEIDVQRDLIEEKLDAAYTSIASIQEQLDEYIAFKGNERLYGTWKDKSRQNDILGIYDDVMSLESVQERLNSILGMDFARSQRDMLNEMQSVENPYFSTLSDTHQRNKMKSVSSGKIAIGVYSNGLTFLSLCQQLKEGEKIQLLDDTQEEETVMTFLIGNNLFEGTVGEIHTIDGDRKISTVIAEKQNTATDNEKEFVLDAAGVNKFTINFDSIITELGFDKAGSISIPYFVLSQPLVKSYIRELGSQKSKFGREYSEDMDLTILQKIMTASEMEEFSQIGRSSWSTLTEKNLKEGVQGTSDKNIQYAALNLFLYIQSISTSFSEVQKIIGIQTSGLGKSFFESDAKRENFIKYILENRHLKNVQNLIGTFMDQSDAEELFTQLQDIKGRINTLMLQASNDDVYDKEIDALKAQMDQLIPDGYVIIGNKTVIKPTTAVGAIVVQALSMQYNMWNDYFPWNNQDVKDVFDDIFIASNVDEMYKSELYEELSEELVRFLWSSDKRKLTKGDVQKTRKELFIDSDENESLASYLNKHVEHVELLKNNALLPMFTYKIMRNGNPSLIIYNNAEAEDYNAENKYNALLMLAEKSIELPQRNEKDYNSRMLVVDMIRHAYLGSGFQEAIEFIKYIPPSLLSELGITESFRYLQHYANNDYLNAWTTLKNGQFIVQYFQHHPHRLPILPRTIFGSKTKSIANDDITIIPLSPTVLLQEAKGDIFIQDFYRYYNADSPKESIMLVRQEDSFVKVPILGTNGLNEYQLGNPNASSLLNKGKIVAPSSNPVPIPKSSPVYSNKFGIGENETAEVLAQIVSMNKEHISQMATIFLTNLDDRITYEYSEEIPSGKLAMINMSTGKVSINPQSTKSMSDEDFANKVILHEMGHWVTAKELEKYFMSLQDMVHYYEPNAHGYILKNKPPFDKDGNFMTPVDQEVPEYIYNLAYLFDKARQMVSQDPEFAKYLETGMLPVGKRHFQAVKNIYEFTAMMLGESSVQEYFNVPMKDRNVTFVQKFFDIFKKMLDYIGYNTETITSQTLANIFAMTEGTNPTNDFNPSEKDVDIASMLDSLEFDDTIPYSEMEFSQKTLSLINNQHKKCQ